MLHPWFMSSLSHRLISSTKAPYLCMQDGYRHSLQRWGRFGEQINRSTC
jgi:hypothetical protein